MTDERDIQDSGDMIEDTTEVEVGEAGIPKLNLVIYGIITTICIYYFFTEIKEKKEPAEKPVATQRK